MKSPTALNKILRGAIRPTPKVSVSEWADKYRMLPSDSPEPGRWSTARVEYMRPVMNAFTEPNIRRIVVKSCSQISKTETLLNIVGRYVHLDPCNILIVQPTLEMSTDFSKSRLEKMIQDTRTLTPLFYEKAKTRDPSQTILSKFFKGGRVVLVGSNSPSGLASRPIKILLCDEIDRYVPTKEGDAIDLAEKRTSNFFDAKVGIFSTPTKLGASRIDVEYELGTQEEWRHECPNCHSLEVLDYRQMECEKRRIKDAVIVDEVYWRCPQCGMSFNEQQMRRAAQMYVVQNPDAIKNGVRSFFINGFASPWLNWKKIMREWLEAEGNPVREAVVMNTRFGLSYEMPGELDDKDFVEGLIQYDSEVPDGVLLLTAGVDVQKNRLEYLIVGWGEEIACGIKNDVIIGEPTNPATWQELDRALNKIFSFADGTTIKIARTFVDSGYSTAEVYNHCRRHQNHFAIKGKSTLGAPLLQKISFQKDAGIWLAILNTDAGKDEIFSMLNAGKFLFGADDAYLKRNFDERFFNQLTAEHRVRRFSGGIVREAWELIRGDRRNEALDTAVYSLAAMKSLLGNADEKFFWQRQRDNLRGLEIKKDPPARRRITSRGISMY